MKIGELARATGLTVETIRYYESRGLLPRHARTGSGYRVFTQEDLEQIAFVQKAKQVGLSLGEIRDILAIQAADQPTCLHVRQLLEEKIEEVDRAMRQLGEFRRSLWQLLEKSGDLRDCRPTGGRVCSIIEGASMPEHPEILDKLKPTGRS